MKKNLIQRSAMLLVPAALSLLAASAGAQEIVRHKIPGSDFPIALAVSVPPTATLHFISGQVPPVVDKAAAPESLAAYGDTRTQSEGVLKKIKEVLAGMGLAMGDVVEMQVFLVGDPAKGSHADTKGFMEAYTQYFGGAQPNLPTRAVVQVAGLSSPGWLVEIQVIAAKK
ncbi:RidA family protein [Rugamonas sp.]|uniref:RidA family protein n=1 Tax=Rugamonas sp. TaxID=1926287 RepID=UPI0025FC79D1|nr:RidA family protein [Rugamonas sp.]